MKKVFIFLTVLCFACFGVAKAQQSLPYSYGFENNNLATDGWTAQISSSSSGISSNAAHSGSYGFRFNYSENPGYLVSPLLTGGTNGIDLSFYYKEYSSSYGDENFQVGYTTNSSVTDPSQFTYGDVIVASTSWQQHTETLPAGTVRMAIKYLYVDAFYLYLDDFSFTTLDLCKTPFNLTSSNVTANTADLAWEGVQDTYTVRYREAASLDYTFFEDFENGLDNWTVYTQGEAPQTNGWYTYDPSQGLSWQAHSGSYVASAWSWTNNVAYAADNYLVSPQVQLGGYLRFYVYTNQGYPDDYEVLLSTGGNAIRDLSVTLQEMAPAPVTGDWVEVNIDLSTYAGQQGYIAIHHVYEDGNYLLIDDFGIGSEIPAGNWNTASARGNTTTISGLNAETNYEWQVQGNCPSGTTEWSSSAYFTTPSNCAAPSALSSADITPVSATLSWTGSQDDYNIQYRKAASFEYNFFDDFENGLDAQGWTTIRNSGGTESTDWHTYNATNFSSGGVTNHSGNYVVMSRSWASSAYTVDNWLISPQVTLDGTLKFWVLDDGQYHEHYDVYVSTTGTDIRSFELFFEPGDASDEWTEVTVDLSSFNGATGYIALRHQDNDQDFLLIDDFGIGFETAAEPWTTVSNVTTSQYTLDQLTANTEYEWRVQGNNSTCDGEVTEWSNIASFATASGIMFIADGNWNDGNNWYAGEVPADGSDVTIAANAIIPADYIAIAGNITIDENGSLTIQDGGQLIHSNTGIIATVEKEITGYTSDKDNYYLISTPVYDQDIYDYYGEDYQLVFPEDVTNMVEGEFDLYSFDFSQDLEWINYKNEAFYLEKYYGYLYANSKDVTLQFTGALTPAPTSLNYLTGYYLPYTEDEYTFANWNMWGNPYPCNTYIFVQDVTNQTYSYDHYKLDGEEFIESDDLFTPAEGGFFITEAASQYALVAIAENSLGKKNFGSSLRLNLTQNGKLIDAARVRFGEGNGLKKFQLNPNHTKIYMTVEGNDYAVVYTENQGEMPVSFKAEENGTYTLSFNTEDIELGYLHLIDNLAGKDVDLLSTPSYSFEAKTTDYANRFRLVFATGNADDNFAFFNNGSLVINNEGMATLQVIDVTGRIINSESINGCANVNVNAAPGVYMIRLVNGDNVKTQKVVVR